MWFVLYSEFIIMIVKPLSLGLSLTTITCCPKHQEALVQLVGLVEVTLRYFLTGRWFDSREKTVCKMGQTSHAKFIY